MSATDYYKPQEHNQPQGGYYPPQAAPPGQNYYPQQPPQAYQQQGNYGPPGGGSYPQPGYAPQPGPQTVYVQQQGQKDSGSNAGCMACLAGICLCCCAEEICDCIF